MRINEIVSYLREYKPMFEKVYGCKEMVVFGSFSRNQQKEGSDLDICCAITEKNALRLEHYLSHRLGIDVEVSRFGHLRKGVLDKIREEGIKI